VVRVIDESAQASANYDEYTRDRKSTRFTDWLRERAEPDWTRAIEHRFTRELGADDLDSTVFRRYLVQDYAFVGDLVGVFGHAVGEAPTMEAKSRLVDFLRTLTADENDYFERSFEALGVPEREYANPEPAVTTRALRDLLGRAAREGGYAETLAVLVPAEWIYLEWASAVDDGEPDRFYLVEWVDLHANPEFREFVGWLRTELDREGAAASTRRQRRLDRLFQRTVELEVGFFEAAYDPEAGVVAPGRTGSTDAGDGGS
jgi:thiaminase/transcriptional activator TenA